MMKRMLVAMMILSLSHLAMADPKGEGRIGNGGIGIVDRMGSLVLKDFAEHGVHHVLNQYSILDHLSRNEEIHFGGAHRGFVHNFAPANLSVPLPVVDPHQPDLKRQKVVIDVFGKARTVYFYDRPNREGFFRIVSRSTVKNSHMFGRRLSRCPEGVERCFSRETLRAVVLLTLFYRMDERLFHWLEQLEFVIDDFPLRPTRDQNSVLKGGIQLAVERDGQVLIARDAWGISERYMEPRPVSVAVQSGWPLSPGLDPSERTWYKKPEDVLYWPLNELNKLGLITHELIYFHTSRHQGDENSDRARKVNARLWEVDFNDTVEYLNMIDQIEWAPKSLKEGGADGSIHYLPHQTKLRIIDLENWSLRHDRYVVGIEVLGPTTGPPNYVALKTFYKAQARDYIIDRIYLDIRRPQKIYTMLEVKQHPWSESALRITIAHTGESMDPVQVPEFEDASGEHFQFIFPEE